MVSPLLRWAGSKRQHVPFLRECWDAGKYSRYVEPFAGSAAVFFAVAPRRAILGDINQELIQTYQTVKRAPDAVYRQLTKFATGEKAYYKVRSMRLRSLVPKAARFVYLKVLL